MKERSDARSVQFDPVYLLARTQFAQHNTKGALANFQKALSYDPEHVHAHIYAGLCQVRLKQMRLARECFKAALEIDPTDVWAHVNLGVAFVNEDPKRSREHYRKALELNPEYPSAYSSYAWFCHHYGTRAEKREIEQLYRKAIELDPEDGSGRAALAQYLFEKKGRQAEAAELAEESLAIDPEGSDAHTLLGYLALARSDYEKAREHAFSALARDPESEDALRLLLSVKSKQSKLLGLWWRVGHFLGRRHIQGSRFGAFFFLFAFLRILSHIVETSAASPGPLLIGFVVLVAGFAGYLAFADHLFQQMMRKEMEAVRISKTF